MAKIYQIPEGIASKRLKYFRLENDKLLNNTEFNEIIKRISKEIQNVDLKSSVELFWSLSKLRIPHQDLINKLTENISHQRNLLSINNINLIFWSCSQMQYINIPFIRTLISELLNIGIRNISTDLIGTLYKSMGKMKIFHEEWFDAFYKFIQKNALDSFSVNSLTNIVYALYKLKIHLISETKNKIIIEKIINELSLREFRNEDIRTFQQIINSVHNLKIEVDNNFIKKIINPFLLNYDKMPVKFGSEFIKIIVRIKNIDNFRDQAISYYLKLIVNRFDEFSKKDCIVSLWGLCKLKKKYDKKNELNSKKGELIKCIKIIIKRIIELAKSLNKKDIILIYSFLDSIKFYSSHLEAEVNYLVNKTKPRIL